MSQNCPECNNEVHETATFCDGCGKSFVYVPAAGTAQITSATKMLTRYKDAYLEARATTAIGSGVKMVGIAIGVACLLVGVLLASQTRESGIYLFASLIFGFVFGTPIYVLGILVSSQGQILKASLDSAVNSSPFLANDERAKVMSLN
jgi:hypothetical protein